MSGLTKGAWAALNDRVEARLPRADRAVNVIISKEGIESLKNGGKAVGQKESIIQASKSIKANYGYRLADEAGKLKGQG